MRKCRPKETLTDISNWTKTSKLRKCNGQGVWGQVHTCTEKQPGGMDWGDKVELSPARKKEPPGSLWGTARLEGKEREERGKKKKMKAVSDQQQLNWGGFGGRCSGKDVQERGLMEDMWCVAYSETTG